MKRGEKTFWFSTFCVLTVFIVVFSQKVIQSFIAVIANVARRAQPLKFALNLAKVKKMA